MNSNFCRLLTAGCFLIWAGHAQANLLTNGSFENTGSTFVNDGNNTMSLASGSSTIPGWTTTNGTFTAWIENGNPWNIPAADGSFFLDLTGYTDSGTYGGVTQSFATTIGTNYVLTFDLGYGGNSGFFGGPVSVIATAGSATGTFTSGSGTPNPAVWDHETFNFTATSANTVLSIVGHSTAGGEYIGLDNADLELGTVSAVPEPATFGFVGLALIGLTTFRLRQRKKA
jgi:Protein of unknown function (DUF642)/PEP-CTERM motif